MRGIDGSPELLMERCLHLVSAPRTRIYTTPWDAASGQP